MTTRAEIRAKIALKLSGLDGITVKVSPAWPTNDSELPCVRIKSGQQQIISSQGQEEEIHYFVQTAVYQKMSGDIESSIDTISDNVATALNDGTRLDSIVDDFNRVEISEPEIETTGIPTARVITTWETVFYNMIENSR